MMKKEINLFDAICPLDFRYYIKFNELKPYLSEEAFIKYLGEVELALIKALAKKGICPKKAIKEVEDALKKVNAIDVYEEEKRIKHNIRALVNCIKKYVSDEIKPYIHLTATSYDIVSTAEALRYKEFTTKVLIPELIKLEKVLIKIAIREKDTLQIGRTHGQHAEPITFGFAIASYVSRLGSRILKIKESANNLRGKFSGAVGAYNASSLLFSNPEEFEKEILKELNLEPDLISTQIVEPEYVVDYLHSIISCFGVLANLADDMRHLQRTEISEVAELFETKQVGSSTMPHKRNPINFENVKSMWKAFMPRIVTVYMDQISEHQRDLTNSASSRFIPEILAGFYVSVKRLTNVMNNLIVDKEHLYKNFELSKKNITAEPAYILLSLYGHGDAHEYVRRLTLKSKKLSKPLIELIKEDEIFKEYLNKFTKKQLSILEEPERYVGIAPQKVEAVCKYWEKIIKQLEEN